MSDGETGKVTGVFVDAEPHLSDEDTPPSWDAILQSFKYYANRLRERMDAAHKGK